jgi:heat shock protein HspQ
MTAEITMRTAAFSIGQVVYHKLFGYRGVIYDVDLEFNGEQEWYERVALSRPPKNQPWYHILVDGQDIRTYVAERNLDADTSREPIEHPLIGNLFDNFKDGLYEPRYGRN